MTFGYRRLSLFSALFTAVTLITGSLLVLSRAIPRLINPEQVNSEGMILIAILGVIINGFGFFRLKTGMSQSEKVLSWHLLENILGWVVLLIGAILIRFLNNPIIDPIMTIGFTVFVLWGVSRNTKEIFNLLLEGVPEHINIDEVKEATLSINGVEKIHDVHIWSLEGETDILTAHVVVKDKYLQEPDRIKQTIKRKLEEHHIEHSTLELESEGFCSGRECIFELRK